MPRERGLAEAGRAVEQQVVERLAARARGADEDGEVLAQRDPGRSSRRACAGAARSSSAASSGSARRDRSPRAALGSDHRASPRSASAHPDLDVGIRQPTLRLASLERALRLLRADSRGSAAPRAPRRAAAALARRGVARDARRAHGAPRAPRRGRAARRRCARPSSRRRPGTARSGAGVAVADRARADPPGSMPESTVCASFGPTRLARSSSSKAVRSSARREAEELERALAHVRVDAQRDGLAVVGQRREGRERDEHLVADAVHVDHARASACARAARPRAARSRPRPRATTRAASRRRRARARARTAHALERARLRVADRRGQRVGGVRGRACSRARAGAAPSRCIWSLRGAAAARHRLLDARGRVLARRGSPPRRAPRAPRRAPGRARAPSAGSRRRTPARRSRRRAGTARSPRASAA